MPNIREMMRRATAARGPAPTIGAGPYASGDTYEERRRATAGVDPNALDASVKQYQGYAREGVDAYGRQLQRPMLQRIGTALGGLNSIGALRSGGTEVALNDIARDTTEDIGNFASRATLDAIGQGTGAAFGTYDRARSAFEGDRDAWERAEQRRMERRRAVGQFLGTAAGFALGGPAGGVAGKKASGG